MFPSSRVPGVCPGGMVMDEIDTCITKWLTQIFVDCNRFNKGEINEVRIEWTVKRIQELKAYG